MNRQVTSSRILDPLFCVTLVVCLAVSCKGVESTDLLTAIGQGKSDIVLELLESGIDPNKKPVAAGMPFEGAYPLHLAVVISDKEIVGILLDNGANVDLQARNKDKATPLHWAAYFQRKGMVLLLIQSGASINALDANNFTPIDSAWLVWSLSRDAEEKAHLRDVMAILKNNGGVSARDL